MNYAMLLARGRRAAKAPIPGGWDISTAVFSQSLDVSAQETSPTDVSFSSDGLKMYIVGTQSADVHQYNLSSPWNISTASHAGSKSVSPQDATPHGIFFTSDGLKMFMVGASNDRVNEYALSAAWTISTATYTQQFGIGAQVLGPTGLFFKHDGLKMYITGDSNVHEYSLGAAWDISTASYVQQFYVLGVTGVFFRPDGRKMYAAELAGVSSVHEYSLGAAWDIGTASYSQQVTVAAQDSAPNGLFFRSDGLTMYVAGGASDRVYKYDLSPT